MINKQNYTQQDVPILYKVMTMKQPVDDISLQFWDNIVQFYQFQVIESGNNNSKQLNQQKQKKLVQLLFAKGKQGYLVIWKFQNGCLMFQKSIKIPYGAHKQITTIKAFTIQQSEPIQIINNIRRQPANILILGYYDGITEVYQIKLEQNSVILSKFLSINNTTQQPVTNVAIYDSQNLYVCRCHHIYFYPQLIMDLYKKIVTKSKQQLNCTQTLLKIKQLNTSSKISMHLSQRNLHIYNQIQGLFSFSVPQMESSGCIIDSAKVLVQTPEGDLVIGSADDSAKIIYADSNQIERIIGLKSFISTIAINELNQQKLVELWMGDMYGEIHYMVKGRKSIVSRSLKQSSKFNSSQKPNQIVLYEEELSRSVKITQNGIKKILLGTNLLIIVDTQMNILVYDVVRNLSSLTGRSTS